MHLTGDNAHKPGMWAIENLQAFFAAQLQGAPYAAQFADVGGVGLTSKPSEALSWVRAKKPWIFFSFDEGDHQRQLWRVPVATHPTIRRGTQHTFGIVMELVIPAACANNVQQLRDAIGDIVDRNKIALFELGFHEVSFQPDSARQDAGTHINPHIFSCVVYSL